MAAERPSADLVVRNLQTASDRIRELTKAGYERAEISRILGIRYQHVRKVLVDAGITAGLSRAKQVPRSAVSTRWAMDLEGNILQYLRGSADGRDRGRHPGERYASFDYCFNYFQSFREAGKTSELAAPARLEMSCLQLGFYLASWGMLRGSSFLLQKSLQAYEPVINAIATMDDGVWEIDAHCYSEANITMLLKCRDVLVREFGRQYKPSDTLVTKVMLGVFGNVPAFDIFVKRALGVSGLGPRALQKVSSFYRANSEVIERYRAKISTLAFATGQVTSRRYTRAKVMDMAFFIEGQRLATSRGESTRG
jgi:hypothetical protein